MPTLGAEATGEVGAQGEVPIALENFADSTMRPDGRSLVRNRLTRSRNSYRNYVVLILCTAIYLLPFMRVLWIGTDEGTLVEGAVRVAHGQVFARDFFEVMGPGSFYGLAAFFKLFGVTFLATRIWLFVTSLGTLILMYFLSQGVCGRFRMLPALLLIGAYCGALWPMVSHHVDSNFFALLSIALMVLWRQKSRNVLLFAAGAVAGITTCIIQPKGILLVLAFIGWLWIQRRRQPGWWLLTLRIAAGYCSVLGLTGLYFWRHGALRNLLYMNFIWPSQHYSKVNVVPYALGLRQYWSHWTIQFHGLPWMVPLALILFVPYLLAAVLPALVPLLGLPLRADNLRPQILLYWLSGWAMWLSEIHRRDIGHLVAASPLLIILCIHFLVEYRRKIANFVLQFLAVCAGLLAAVNLLLVLSPPLIHTRVGNVAMFNKAPALEFLDSHLAPGMAMFAYPYSPMYYFLSGTNNPTRYSLLVYNYNTPSQFLDVIQTLDREKVKYVLWNTKFYSTAGIFNFTPAAENSSSSFLMEPYLESHYRVVADFNGMRIMERKVTPNGDQR